MPAQFDGGELCLIFTTRAHLLGHEMCEIPNSSISWLRLDIGDVGTPIQPRHYTKNKEKSWETRHMIRAIIIKSAVYASVGL